MNKEKNMTKEEFVKILKQKKYQFYQKDEEIVITEEGFVELDSCTSLPNGVRFENDGEVYLEDCTTLPKGLRFKNNGDVHLESCTTLLDGIIFENRGDVNLEECKKLPTNIKFENTGFIDMESCSKINYQGEDLTLKFVGGHSLIVDFFQSIDGLDIYKGRYLQGGKLESLPVCFIVQKDEYVAQAQSIEEVIGKISSSFLGSSFDVDSLVASMKEKL